MRALRRGPEFLVGDVGERGGCVGQKRCTGCPVGDQGLVCDVRGVDEALAGDASAGDFVSRVEFFGDAGNAPKRTEYVPVGVVEGLGSDVTSYMDRELSNERR